ncbi:zf-HC2 domain-containing protein [uncultured Bacteroides sp.]|uniref:anti-sigma factor family protein n=1 Tax=uncultured Bacteroides sp. TaxID=162156 RepID=UPI0025FB5F48|nr:zf-HC2 domain-containing protein [uncultured Bacteroides sp.]
MKKQCGYKHSDIWLYIQNRMSREEETEFQQHLLNCEECGKELVRLRLMVQSIGKKERRNIPFRIWMVAASVTCILMGGGACYYFLTQRGGTFSPGDSHELKINPPILHNNRDSIAPQDTIPADTILVKVMHCE